MSYLLERNGDLVKCEYTYNMPKTDADGNIGVYFYSLDTQSIFFRTEITMFHIQQKPCLEPDNPSYWRLKTLLLIGGYAVR